MTTERSEFHQTQIPDTNQRNTSVTDIATEIITAVQKPSLDMVGKRPSKGWSYYDLVHVFMLPNV